MLAAVTGDIRSSSARPMPTYPPMGALAAVIDSEQIEQFLAVPAPGTSGLHVTDATRSTADWRESFADNVLAEVMGALLKGFDEDLVADSGTQTARMLEASWVGPNGATPSVAMPATNHNQARIVRRARSLGVPVRYSRFYAHQLVKTEHAGYLFGPRPPVPIGRLESSAQIIDTPELFDVSISKMEKPGLVARKVKRKKPELAYFRVRQSPEWTRIDHQRLDDEFVLEVANADLVGIAMPTLAPIAVTSADATPLPHMSDWHRGDYRGLHFASWAYDQVLRRLGL